MNTYGRRPPGTSARGHDVEYRKRAYDPHLDVLRKAKSASFKAVFKKLLTYVRPGQLYAGEELAWRCSSYMSRATVWAYLHWLVDRKLMQEHYNGAKMYFSWSEPMSPQAKRWGEYLKRACFG